MDGVKMKARLEEERVRQREEEAPSRSVFLSQQTLQLQLREACSFLAWDSDPVWA